MGLPLDVKDLYRFGKEILKDRDEPVRIAVVVETDAPEALVDAAEEALRPRTTTGSVDVRMADEPAATAPADAAVLLVGSAGEAMVEAARAWRASVTPTTALVSGGDGARFAARLGLPLDDVFADEDARFLVGELLAGWLADRLSDKRLSLAVNFEFCRRKVAEEIVKTTAMQNAMIGTIAVLPGTDMPLMTANQAKMLLQLATAYGQRIGADRLGELAAVVGGGFLFRAVARQALTAVPGFGWFVKGGVAYVGTMSMGRAAIAWFEQGADLSEVARRIQRRARRSEPVEVEATVLEGEADSTDESGLVQQRLELEPADGGS
ncbi:MAG: hypothetical protein Kow0056_04130 [Coriobacteriia bacterium]